MTNTPGRSDATIPWIDSLLLHERQAIVQSLSAGTFARDRERESSRLSRWRSQTPFGSDSSFVARLEIDGLSKDQLDWILADITADAHQDPSLDPPDWPTTLLRIYSDTNLNRKAEERARFDAFVRPLVRWVDGIISLKLDTISCPAFDDEGRQVFRAAVRRQVGREGLALSYRALVLELNIARVTEKLKAPEATDRFHEFCEWLNTEKGALQIFREYPVLARRMVTRAANLADAAVNLAHFLADDYASLCSDFSVDGELGPLRQLDLGLGDSHNDGRSVAVLSFKDDIKVVYKPRSGAVDVQFGGFADWVNGISGEPDLRAVRVLDRADHAWYEYIEAQACESTEAMSRFYRRIGVLLALLYCIEATDIHFENIVACGEYPLVVDMETILQPRQLPIHHGGVLAFMQALLEKSVMRVGLLPQPIWAREGRPGVDISGIGVPGCEKFWVEMAQIEGRNTDHLRIVPGRGELPRAANRPVSVEPISGINDRLRDIIDGFTNAYNAVLRHQIRLSDMLDAAVSVPIRTLLRPSMVYARLLDMAAHPDALRNGRELSFVLDRLWVGATLIPKLSSAILDERRQLMSGDIPLFNTQAGSRDLASNAGTIAAGFFSASGIEEAKHKLACLSPHDLRKQVWTITATMTSAAPKERVPWSSQTYGDCSNVAPGDPSLFLREAVDIAEHLIAASESDGQWIGWKTLRESREGQWSLSTTGFDLYDGLSGISMFFGYLGILTRSDRYLEFARKCIESALAFIGQVLSNETFAKEIQLGAFTGLGSLIYALDHLDHVLSREYIEHQYHILIEEAIPRVEADECLDIVGGSAGLGAVIYNIRLAKRDRLLRCAEACGNRLQQRARKDKASISWPLAWKGDVGLTGYAHGSAGIEVSLLRLSEMSQNAELRELAENAIVGDRAAYDISRGGGKHRKIIAGTDSSDLGEPVGAKWCHGAVGIGMARVAAAKYLGIDRIAGDVEASLANCNSHQIHDSDCMCHGVFGVADFFIEVSREFERPEMLAQARSIIADRVSHLSKWPWRSAAPGYIDTPGLMTGLAGIGYGLLRVFAPKLVPSILNLSGGGKIK